MKAADDRITLSIPSNPRYLCAVRAFLGNLLQELGYNSAEADGVVLAIHEACVNIIEHRYQGDIGQRIDLTMLVAPEWLTVEIQDYGTLQDVTVIQPRALQDVRPGGLGTYFMRAIMDDVTYNASDTGTLVRMTKRRSVPCTSP
jgi:anti-sigma regulatory factor (Ser/Thr protein kinase)